MKQTTSAPVATLAPRASHKVPADVIKGQLAELRRRFYPREADPAALKDFCRDRQFLIQAITFPAAFLTGKMGDGCPLPWPAYEQILNIVMCTIEREGRLGGVRNFSRYFLHCVQTHMPHNWERYSTQAKSALHMIESGLAGILDGAKIPADSTVRDLAAIHADLRIRGGRKAGPKPAKTAVPKAPKPARDSEPVVSRDSDRGIQRELF